MDNNPNDSTSSNYGYVYILSNPSMPGLLKIGMTRFDPSRRVQELSSATGVPTPFQLVYYREFNNCVAAEYEIHSILAAKGLRYNDQREFFTIDTVEAINTLLSLENLSIKSSFSESIIVENYNENFDWEEDYKVKRKYSETYRNSELYKEFDVFIQTIRYKPELTEEEIDKLKYFVDSGILPYVETLAWRICKDDVQKQIDLILSYAQKGYVSGYIDAVKLFLESIDGINNVTPDNRLLIAKLLDNFARNYKNASANDIYIEQSIDFYCGISRALGLQYDKSFLKALLLDDDSVFSYETWLWGAFSTSEDKGRNLCDQLRSDKDAYLGSSTQLEHEILSDERYKRFHSAKATKLYYQGCNYAYGLNGTQRDVAKAEEFWRQAITQNFKKAYFNLSILYYSDEEAFDRIINKGIADSYPQCLMLALGRTMDGIIIEDDITKAIRNKINRYLDLFFSQIDLAFYVDPDSCLDAIKTYISISIAFKRSINKKKIKEIIDKIKAVPSPDIEEYYSNMGEYIGCFDDFALIEQEAVLTMKQFVGLA